MKKYLIIIFSDLDGTILHRSNFKFDKIKKYIKKLISHKIIVVPNTSKTELEIKDFMKELGIKLPFICENGSAIYNLNLINPKLPKKIILSRNIGNIDVARYLHNWDWGKNIIKNQKGSTPRLTQK